MPTQYFPSMEFLGKGCCLLKNQSTNHIKEDKQTIPWVNHYGTLCYPPWGHGKSLWDWGSSQQHGMGKEHMI